MCDTVALITNQGTWLAKNSDRHPEEVQRVEYHPATPLTTNIQCTYISVEPQVTHAHAAILGRPEWMWGAEMGVNEHGVAIGNEAVFTRFSKHQKREPEKLLGMDLLRLALMQTQTAEQAISTITHYLTVYGQGGNAGFADKSFYYDNSFLIADRSSAWVLETAGIYWAARKIQSFEAISNTLIIGSDFQLSNIHKPISFSKMFSQYLLPRLARANTRRQQNLDKLKKLDADQSTEGMLAACQQILSGHQSSGKQNTGNVCMHAKGRFCPDETVNSMIAFIPTQGEPQVWMTGCSHPCQAEFNPVAWSQDNWFVRYPSYWEERRSRLNREVMA